MLFSISPESFRLMIENTLDIITVLDIKGTILYESPAIFRTLGYPPDELVGKNAFAYIHPLDVPGALKTLGIVLLKPAQPHQIRIRFKHKDGTWRVLEIVGQFVRDGTGPHVFLNCRDITERTNAESERELLVTAVQQSSESIVITDAEGTIQYVNPAFERLTGYSRQEAIGKNPRILKSNKHGPDFYKEMWSTLKSGRPWSGHLINKRKDGTFFEEEATLNPVMNASGGITNFVAVKRDITERRRMESIVNQSEKLSAVGQLAAGVAHEINNPLAVILGFAQSIMGRLQESDPMHNPIKSIEREALRCRNLVQDLLTFSRQRKAGVALEAVVPTIEGAMNLVETQARVKSIVVRRDFSSDVPLIQADRTQIQQVIINLCTNAFDAMPSGGTLTVQVRGQKTHVEIRVTDTGTGIPADIQGRIFEPFFTTKEVGKGTGLGLSLVYEIVKNHQGTIDLETEAGKGTTFIVRLPAAERPSSAGSEDRLAA